MKQCKKHLILQYAQIKKEQIKKQLFEENDNEDEELVDDLESSTTSVDKLNEESKEKEEEENEENPETKKNYVESLNV